jgi:hypothetical protein
MCKHYAIDIKTENNEARFSFNDCYYNEDTESRPMDGKDGKTSVSKHSVFCSVLHLPVVFISQRIEEVNHVVITSIVFT